MAIKNVFAETTKLKQSIENLSVEALQAELEQNAELLLIDLREIQEVIDLGTIPGAKNVARGMLEFWADPASPYYRDYFGEDKRMVVFCAGTTGYNLTMDARYVWMHQKRIQGSHFAHLMQASQANRLVINRRIDPCMSEVYDWNDIPKGHMRMRENKHLPGNMAVLVNAPTTGLRTFEDVLEACGS